MTELRILVCDDHTLVRQALRRILEDNEDWQVVAEAGNGRDAVRMAVAEQPDVAIMDVTMPEMDGVDAVALIRQQAPSVRVLMLSMHSDEVFVGRALGAGARGYLLKSAVDADLIRAVEVIAGGGAFFSPAVASVLAHDYVRRAAARDPEDRMDLLSEREREVFQLVAEGRPSRAIADLLEIRPATVETHRARILHKLNIHNTAELVRSAVRHRVIS